MTLTLHLPPELEERLKRAAEQQGIPAEAFTVRALEAYLTCSEPRADLGALLQSWVEEGEASEQIETGTYLIRALDEDRFSTRKLFPPELEGVSW